MTCNNLGLPNGGLISMSMTKTMTEGLSGTLLKEISIGEPVYVTDCKQLYVGSSSATITDGTVDSIIPAVSLAEMSGCDFPQPSYVLDIDDGTVKFYNDDQWYSLVTSNELDQNVADLSATDEQLALDISNLDIDLQTQIVNISGWALDDSDLNVIESDISQLQSDVIDISGNLVYGSGNDTQLAVFSSQDTVESFASLTYSLASGFTTDEITVSNLAGSSDLVTTVDVNGKLQTTQVVVNGGDVTIPGNLYVNGTEFIVNVESISAADNIIILNSGEVGPGITSGYSGIRVDRGSSDDYFFVFDEYRDGFVIGVATDETSGSLSQTQMVATREDAPIDQYIAYWNDSENRFDTTGGVSIGTLIQNSEVIAATVDASGSTQVDSVSLTEGGVVWYYVIEDNTNYRMGQVMVVTNGSTVQFTEMTTSDIGDTSAVTFDASYSGGDIELNVTNTGGSWDILLKKSIISEATPESIPSGFSPLYNTVPVIGSNVTSSTFANGITYTPLAKNATEQYVEFEFVANKSGTLKIGLNYSMSVSDLGDVVLGFESLNVGESDDPSVALSDKGNTTITPGSGTTLKNTDLEYTSYNITVGEYVYCKILRRNVAGDDHTGDLRIIGITLEIE